MLVDSRVFIDSDIEICRMVPMLDLANDLDNPNAERVLDAKKTEKLVALRDIKEGHEIGISYLGDFQLTRAYYFKYGFVKDNQETHHVETEVCLNPNHPFT